MLTLTHNNCPYTAVKVYNAICDIRYSINIVNRLNNIRNSKYLGNCWDIFDYDYYMDAPVQL